MAEANITLDQKSAMHLQKRLQSIVDATTPKANSPITELLFITGLDIATNAKKRCPVFFGRLRASIHPKFKSNDSFNYTTTIAKKDGKVNKELGVIKDGSLKEPIVQYKEVVVGTNVVYAFKMETRNGFLQGGVIDSKPAMKRRLKSLAAKVVGGKPNINIT